MLFMVDVVYPLLKLIHNKLFKSYSRPSTLGLNMTFQNDMCPTQIMRNDGLGMSLLWGNPPNQAVSGDVVSP